MWFLWAFSNSLASLSRMFFVDGCLKCGYSMPQRISVSISIVTYSVYVSHSVICSSFVVLRLLAFL